MFSRVCDENEQFSFWLSVSEGVDGEYADVGIKLSSDLIEKIIDGFNDVACFEHAPDEFEIYEVSTR